MRSSKSLTVKWKGVLPALVLALAQFLASGLEAKCGEDASADNYRRDIDLYTNGSTIWKRPAGKFEEQLTELTQTVEKERESKGGSLADDLSNLGNYYEELDSYDKSKLFYGECLRIRQASLPPGHPDIGAALHNLGACYERNKEPGKARFCYEHALKCFDSPSANRLILAAELSNLGEFYFQQQKFDLCEPLLKRSLAIQEKLKGEDDPSLADTLQALAMLLDEQGKANEARPYHLRAEAMHRRNWRTELNASGRTGQMPQPLAKFAPKSKPKPVHQSSLTGD